mgnify:CR=1 FL=1
MFSRLIRQCAWCKRLLGVSEPTPPGTTGATHTICQCCVKHFTKENT